MRPKTCTTTTMLVVTRSGLRNPAAGVTLDEPAHGPLPGAETNGHNEPTDAVKAALDRTSETAAPLEADVLASEGLDAPVPVLEAQPAPQFDADLLPDAAAELAGKTIDEIVEWVGSNPVRAAAALEANAASDNFRKTLPDRLAPVTDSLTKEN